MRRLVATTILLASASLASAFSADAGSCSTQTNNTYKKLLECVTLDGAREHQLALKTIADANGGIRTSGTPGYDQSVDYAVGIFEDAGYDVTVQEFQFQTFIVLSPSVLEQVSPRRQGRSSTTSCRTPAAVTSRPLSARSAT